MMYTFDNRFLDIPEYSTSHQLQVTKTQERKLDELIVFIWPEQDRAVVKTQFYEIIAEAQKRLPVNSFTEGVDWSEKQIVLICYGDHIRSKDPDKSPLQALGEFCQQQFQEEIFSQLTIHLLPIYPSPYVDGGFDAIDPFEVNPKIGTWEDVRLIRQYFQVAVDFIPNHLSSDSEWFALYMQDDPVYRDFFIGFDNQETVQRLEQEALPKIHRPRLHNPFVPVTKADGSTRWVYMTITKKQPDINYHNPFAFLKMTEVLLFYILQGVSMVRLDAIPYLWKEWGTSCAHHSKTHALVELFRLATDLVNPTVKLLAESMEPLADSMQYLSTKKQAKAHIAYNFVPCGLIPHTLLTEDASVFQKNLENFVPSGEDVNWAVVCGVTHDGSSLNPCRAPKSVKGESVLTEDQINTIARYYTEHGYREIETRNALAPDHPHHIRVDFIQHFSDIHKEKLRFVNYKAITDEQGQRRQIVYEAISTYASLFDQNPNKIVAALAMALCLPGIPFTYLTLPFAILNDYNYYLETGNPRELNRGRVIFEDLIKDLADEETLTYKVFSRYKQLLCLRASHPAFHPHGQLVTFSSNNTSIISFLRISIDNSQYMLIVQNVSSVEQEVKLELKGHIPTKTNECVDLISEKFFPIKDNILSLVLEPFTVFWLECR